MNRNEVLSNQSERPTANFQMLLSPDKVGWLHAALRNQPEVALYEGRFLEPFDTVSILAMRRQNNLIATALFNISDGMRDGFGDDTSIGSDEMISLLGKRYPENEVAPDKSQMVVGKNGAPAGLIARINPDQIAIQVGGQAGNIEISDDSPVTDISLGINQFSLLVQRFVNYTWQTTPELKDRKLTTALTLPEMPEGAPETYFSTFEIVGKDYRVFPRPVDLQTQIGGFKNVKDEFESLVLDLNDPEKSRRFGTQPYSNRFVLLTGAEGTGKSLFLKGLNTRLKEALQVEHEHFRLPMGTIVENFGNYSGAIIGSVLDHVRANEKSGVPTVLHIDNLEALCAPDNGPAFARYTQIATPVINVLRDFGKELGPESHNLIVVGESRAPRGVLPDGVQKVFRRTFELKPGRQDLIEAVRVQVATARLFAEKTGIDPFDPSIDGDLSSLIQHPYGLTGRDIQQAILSLSARNKARGEESDSLKITPADIAGELVNIQLSRGIDGRDIRRVGFRTANSI